MSGNDAWYFFGCGVGLLAGQLAAWVMDADWSASVAIVCGVVACGVGLQRILTQ